MHSMSVQLSAESEQRIKAQLQSGLYGSADEVVQAALIALDEIRARQLKLQADLESRSERDRNGLSAPLDIDAFLASARRRLAADA